MGMSWRGEASNQLLPGLYKRTLQKVRKRLLSITISFLLIFCSSIFFGEIWLERRRDFAKVSLYSLLTFFFVHNWFDQSFIMGCEFSLLHLSYQSIVDPLTTNTLWADPIRKHTLNDNLTYSQPTCWIPLKISKDPAHLQISDRIIFYIILSNLSNRITLA